MKSKVLCGLAALTMSASALAADAARNENRMRILGESVVSVSKCSDTVISTEEFQDYVRRADGSMAQHKDGTFIMKTMTRISAKSSINISKCQSQENYLVAVTGSMWNSKESEVAGSARQSGVLVSQTTPISQSQDIDLKKLVSATSGGVFNDSSTLQILNSIQEGIKVQVKNECEAKVAQLNATRVAISQTACNN